MGRREVRNVRHRPRYQGSRRDRLQRVCERFEENAIDGEMLADLLGRPEAEGDADFMNELGMLKLQIGKLRRDLGRLAARQAEPVAVPLS